jgi:hypothetical protein
MAEATDVGRTVRSAAITATAERTPTRRFKWTSIIASIIWFLDNGTHRLEYTKTARSWVKCYGTAITRVSKPSKTHVKHL